MASFGMGHYSGGKTSGWKDLMKIVREKIQDDRQQRANKDMVSINIGGDVFKINKDTLKRFPNTRLGKLDESSDSYDKDTKSHFFDRNPALFRYILDYYKTGELHLPQHLCARMMDAELSFWEIEYTSMKDCCKKKFEENMEKIVSDENLLDEFLHVPNIYNIQSQQFKQHASDLKNTIWKLLNDQYSSIAAKVWHAVYMVLVVMSVLVFFTSTLDSCRVPKQDSLYCIGFGPETVNKSQGHDQIPKIQRLLNTTPHPVLQIIELLCLVVFTVEFIFRFVVCPERIRLFKTPSTLVDILYIVPAWIVIIVEIAHGVSNRQKHNVALFVALEALLIFRVFRITRFVKHVRGLRLLFLAIRNSFHELALLFVFVCFNITIYASLIYCAEIFSPDYFDNAYHGVWWALITMTTVGYGDMYPTSWLGYLVGSFCAVTGIIMIQMPVPIIVSNFHAYYGLRLPDEDEENEAEETKSVSPEVTEFSISPLPLPKDEESCYHITVNDLPFIPSNRVGDMNEESSKSDT